MLDSHSVRNVIDISCGTGNHISGLLKLARERSIQRQFFAMDASKEMIEIARSKMMSLKSPFEMLQGDFLKIPFRLTTFDCAICMYWSLAGLDHEKVRELFLEVNSILNSTGLFVFDVENSEGIKEDLLNNPFIDAFFDDEGKSVIRANYSRKIEPDLVDWHAYYLVENRGISELVNDRLMLRFYSLSDLSKILRETGFKLVKVYSAPFVEYKEHSPSLYIVAEKNS
jgi:ubiquinone/menaquinone biosynthesis C-methylase UbiE